MNMFETATKQKLRFSTTKGSLSVEELWDLSVTSLDNLAKGVNKLLKDTEEESFIPNSSKNSGNATLTLQLDILKHIIEKKVAAKDAAKKRAETLAKNARIDELIETKKEESLASLSVEELEKLKES